MTNVQAGILAGMMPEGAAEVLRAFGKSDMDNIPGADIDYLKEFKLIERQVNVFSGEKIWVLTNDGKKVRKFL